MQRAREEGEVPPTETGVLFVGTEGAGEALSSGFFFFLFWACLLLCGLH